MLAQQKTVFYKGYSDFFFCNFQVFKPLVDNAGLWKGKNGSKPVEFLVDMKLDFQDYNKLKFIRVTYFYETLPQIDIHVRISNGQSLSGFQMVHLAQTVL